MINYLSAVVVLVPSFEALFVPSISLIDQVQCKVNDLERLIHSQCHNTWMARPLLYEALDITTSTVVCQTFVANGCFGGSSGSRWLRCLGKHLDFGIEK